MSIQYNTLTPDNSATASKLIQTVLHTYNATDYTEEGIVTLMEFTSATALREMLSAEKTVAIGAYDGDTKLVGVCIIRDWSHLTLFFVDGDYHGQGIGRNLFEKALTDCRAKNPDLEIMTVNSSLYAVEAYKKLGFIAGSDEPERRNGIVFVPMKRTI